MFLKKKKNINIFICKFFDWKHWKKLIIVKVFIILAVFNNTIRIKLKLLDLVMNYNLSSTRKLEHYLLKKLQRMKMFWKTRKLAKILSSTIDIELLNFFPKSLCLPHNNKITVRFINN